MSYYPIVFDTETGEICFHNVTHEVVYKKGYTTPYIPKVLLQWSDDGGKTWSNGRWLDVGKIGEYQRRCKTDRLGMSRDRVFRVICSDPIKIMLVGARIDATIANN